jgi:hypothetical protein
MANQMIALQSRAPQLPDPSRLTAQYANMMNMTRQQEAAERQAAAAQQQMDYATAEEGRKKQLHGPALTKAQQDNAVQALEMFRNAVGDVDENDIAAKEAVRADLVSRIPGYDKFIPPASQWTRDTIVRLMMDSDKEIDKLYATPVASLEVDEAGNPRSVQVGGLNPQQSPVYDAPPPMAAAPRATPTAPQAAPANPFAPGYKPNSAAAPVNSLSLVVDSALETGVMAKSDFDKLVRIAQPGIGPKLEAWVRQNNITIAPDAPGVTDNQMRGAPADFEASPMSYDGQTPQSQFAVYRGEPMQSQTAGLRGAPEMQQTLAQTQPRTVTKLQRRDPNVSPAPAETPQQAGDRARSIRQTPAEAAAVTAAIENTKVGIQKDAKIAEENRLKTKGRKLFSAALNDMRSDYNTLNKLRAIPSTGRPMLDNIGDYIGASRVGRIAQSAVGSKASVALNNIANSRLTLLNALKEVTGMSAAQLSSNVELMTFLDSLADPTQGYESAMETIRRLENLYGAPAAAQGKRRTPVVASGWGQAKVVGN